MKLNAGCEMTIEAAEISPAVLMLQPQSGDGQGVIHSEISIEPGVPFWDFTDAFGNLCRRITLSKGQSIIRSTCQVMSPDEIGVEPHARFTIVQDLPDDVLQF